MSTGLAVSKLAVSAGLATGLGSAASRQVHGRTMSYILAAMMIASDGGISAM